MAVGGQSQFSFEYTDVTEIFNITAQNWTLVDSFPSMTSGLTLTAVGSDFYAFGGAIGDPAQSSDSIFVYRSNVWITMKGKLRFGYIHNNSQVCIRVATDL